jgi:hypothetical protein
MILMGSCSRAEVEVIFPNNGSLWSSWVLVECIGWELPDDALAAKIEDQL